MSWSEYVNKTAFVKESTTVVVAFSNEFVVPVIKLAGSGVKGVGKGLAFCTKATASFITKKPHPIDSTIANRTCIPDVIENTPPLNASEVAKEKLNEALKQGDYSRFKDVLGMVSDLEKLDPQAVSITFTCCLAALAKKSAPCLKNICIGLIHGL